MRDEIMSILMVIAAQNDIIDAVESDVIIIEHSTSLSEEIEENLVHV